jgi:hypothetical protein
MAKQLFLLQLRIPERVEEDRGSAFWLPPRDSNPDMLLQRQLSYH